MNINIYSQVKKLPRAFLEEHGIKQGRDNILIFPYYDEDEKFFRNKLRIDSDRFWGNDEYNDREEKTLPYGLWKMRYTPILYIAAGETDCLTLWYHGYNAIGLPSEAFFKREWVEYLQDYKEVILIPDNDGAGIRSIEIIKDRLIEGEYKGRFFVMPVPQEYKDLNEFYADNPDTFKKEFEKLYGRRQQVLTVPERAFVMDGMIPVRHVTVFYGDPGKCKSWVAMCIAVCVAAGIFCWKKTVSKGSVAYLDFELDQDELERRAYEVAMGLGLLRIPDNLELRSYSEEDVFIDEILEELEEETKKEERVLTIVDSFGAAFGLTEDTSDTKEVIRQNKRLRRHLGTCLVVDHPRKEQWYDRKKSRQNRGPHGTMFKVALNRNMFYVEYDESTQIIQLYEQKANFKQKDSNPIELKINFLKGKVTITLIELRDEVVEIVQALGGRTTFKKIKAK